MKISILHPSRSRPNQALSTIIHWLSNTSGMILWEYILSVDSNDPYLNEYNSLSIPNNNHIRMIVNDNQNIVHASNKAANDCHGDIIVLASDDFTCFKDWDLAIIKALEGKSGVLKTFDGVQRWIVTLPIMTRDYFDEQGYIYHPSYQHCFCDTDQTHKADLQKKLIIRNDIFFKHNHHSTKGGQPKDEVNKKADLTWAQGEKVYLDRCRNKFGLQGVNIYDLSPEASKAGHVNWLKKKLR